MSQEECKASGKPQICLFQEWPEWRELVDTVYSPPQKVIVNDLIEPRRHPQSIF